MTWNILWDATLDTLYMLFSSTLFATLIGIPLGILLFMSNPELGMYKGWGAQIIHRISGLLVNLFRSIPFIILILLLIPVTRWLVQTSVGPTAAIIPLVVGAAPFVARLVETSLREVNKGVIEAAESMGASRWNIIWKVLLPEARPGIISGITVTMVNLVGFTAMAGVVGAGGLGDLAIRFGYYAFDYKTTLITTLILVILVQLIQMSGDFIVKRIDKR